MMSADSISKLQPAKQVGQTTAYRVPPSPTPVDLFLDGNEGAIPSPELIRAVIDQAPDVLRRYPKKAALEATLAARLGVKPEQVLVTAGGDDGLDRICRTMLSDGREFVLPEPSFEMLNRYASLAGGKIISVDWPDGPYPREAVLRAITPQTGLIAFVSPNNPTGTVASAEDLRAISAAAPHALVLADLAYVEFAEHDLTLDALALRNVVVVRTFSKAWGLAGLRVGYLIGPAEVIGWLRAAGGPYTVSGPSLAMASACFAKSSHGIELFIGSVIAERTALNELLRSHGVEVTDSQANFIFARFQDAVWIKEALAGFGISVRHFADRPQLQDGLRITCPGHAEQRQRLTHALETTLAPDAILFDMDGVLADPGDAYSECVVAVLAECGVAVTLDQVHELGAQHPHLDRLGKVQHILAERGQPREFKELFAIFSELYFADDGPFGWSGPEPALVSVAWLRELAQRFKLAIVTSRFRGEAERFMRTSGYDQVIDVVMTADDAPTKPDPTPLRLACERLGAKRAWMIGDSSSDIVAARAAGVLPVGCITPGAEPSAKRNRLLRTGASRVLDNVLQLTELLP
jgi:histidinol-phosphate aminotransferase